MKQNVIEILIGSESDAVKFNQLTKIYREIPTANKHLVLQLNKMSLSKTSLAVLTENVKKELKISDLDLHFARNKKQVSTKGTAKKEKKEDKLAEVKIEVKPEPKLREEFPFLNDPDCPEEFKILVADKITAFKALQEVQAKLELIADGTLIVTKRDKAGLAELAVEIDMENSLIYDELRHYQDKKEVLGVHPIFKERQLLKELELMSGPEKLQRFTTLKSDISREKGNLTKAKKKDPVDLEKVAEIEERLAKKELELKLLKKLTD